MLRAIKCASLAPILPATGACRAYARGRVGTIERICGAFPNPEELAYGFDGLPKRPLYRVCIRQTDIWPDYKGSDKDVLELEIYEHWLEKA